MKSTMLVALALAGCSGSVPPKCVTVDTSCAASYVPNFHNIYTNTITSSCGVLNSSCHSAANHAGGMSFVDEATAYAALLAPKSTIDPSRPRLVAGNPACSLVVVRVDSPGQWQMPPPPGDQITPGERCAFIQWIANGAGSGM
jgi:hypothetical protein